MDTSKFSITNQSELDNLCQELNNSSIYDKLNTILEIKFCPGIFTISEPLFISGFPKVTISGTRTSLQSSDGNVEQVTTIQVTKNFIFTQDDSIVNIRGYMNQKVEVEITDLALKSTITRNELSQLHYSWHIQSMLLIKICEASNVVLTRLDTDLRYLNCTNIDLRWCDRVEVRNCNFVNYNSRKTGGCLWLRNNVSSALITNNTFRKYGNDETLAVWIEGGVHKGKVVSLDDNHDTATTTSYVDENRNRTIQNVIIQRNQFYCDLFDTPLDSSLLNAYKDIAKAQAPSSIQDGSYFAHESQWNGFLDVNIAIYTTQTCQLNGDASVELYRTQTELRNVKLQHNDFHIDSPITSNISLTLDRYCTLFDEVEFIDNTIEYGAWEMEGHYLIDFNVTHDIIDETSLNPLMPARVNHISNRHPVNICGNTIHSKCLPYFNWNPKQESHICLRIGGLAVNFAHNHMEIDINALSAQRATFNSYSQGIDVVFCQVRTAFVRLVENVCQNIQHIGTFTKSGPSLDNVVIESIGNIFVGYTQINNNQISNQRLYFKGNAFFSYGSYLFLRRVSSTSEVVFVDNRIHYEDNGNPTFAYLSSGTPETMLNVLVSDNVFDNITQDDSTHDMFSYLRNRPNVTLWLARNQYAP